MLHGFPHNHHSIAMTAFSHTINTLSYVSVALNDSAVGSRFLFFEVIMPLCLFHVQSLNILNIFYTIKLHKCKLDMYVI